MNVLEQAILEPLAAGDPFGAACGAIGIRDLPAEQQRAIITAVQGTITSAEQATLLAATRAAEAWYQRKGTPAPPAEFWLPGTPDATHPAAWAVRIALAKRTGDTVDATRMAKSMQRLPAEQQAQIHALLAKIQ